MTESAASLFRKLPSVRALSRPAQARALALMQERRLVAGERLFSEGEPAEHLFLVLAGGLLVTAAPADGELLPLGKVHAGEVIGEMGMLDFSSRSATVVGEQPAVLLSIDRPTYERLVAEGDELAFWIIEATAQGLARRIGTMTERIVAAALDPGATRSLPAEPRRQRRGWLAALLARRG
jgi:CRP-like cAMP-binding protein